MPATIICSRLPADATQRGDLEKLFGSPAFLFLKEMVASRCIEAQVESMNAGLYGDNEAAVEKKAAALNRASDLNKILDLLDDLSGKEDEWFTVKLEHANH